MPLHSTLYRLRERRTRFIDIFRTTPPKTVCPNFYVLAHANGCAFTPRCDYCYLISTFWHLEGDQAFTNVDRLVQETRRWIGRDELESYVLNSGNLSDSLAFEWMRPMVRQLVDVFRKEAEAKGRPHTLLLLTKGGMAECAPLLELAPCANVVFSVSVNAPAAARQYERGAAPVNERFRAVAALLCRGWRVRVRLDPMITGFDYAGVIDRIRRLRPERVTLGTLRAEDHLFRQVRDTLFADLDPPEVPGGLFRYALARRLDLYRPAVIALREACPVALCEETPDVWDILGLDKEANRCNCCQ